MAPHSVPIPEALKRPDSPQVDALREYTRAVIPWQLGAPACAADTRDDGAASPERLLKAALRAPREHVLLLGLGDGVLARALAEALPAGRTLTVCTLDPDKARRALLEPGPWLSGRHAILTDTSPRAVLLLLHAFGRDPARCTMMLSPALSGEEREACRGLQRLLVTTDRLWPEAGTEAVADPSLMSVAAILHPDEPRLEEFFAGIPAWVRELVVVWDADEPPGQRPDAACPTRHLARRLAGDFAAQRNAALEHAASPWVFFLDGDERLTTDHWAALPGLAARAQALKAGGVAWPRMTFWPDQRSVLTGFGLWPDLQLRLMPVVPGLRFERPVHEVVAGLPGPVLVDAGRQIRHFSRIYKNQEQLAAKLRTFDAAAGERLHRLNDEYPTLSADFMRRVSDAFAPGCLLRLHAS